MKKKWLIPLSLAGLMLFGGIAFAEGRYKTIEVFLERIDIKLNGQPLEISQDRFCTTAPSTSRCAV